MNKQKLLALALSFFMLLGNTGLSTQTVFANDSSNIGGITMDEIIKINNENQGEGEENTTAPIEEEPTSEPQEEEEPVTDPQEEEEPITVPQEEVPAVELPTEPEVVEPLMAMALEVDTDAQTASDIQKQINDAVGAEEDCIITLENDLELTKSLVIPAVATGDKAFTLTIDLGTYTIKPASDAEDNFPLINVKANNANWVHDESGRVYDPPFKTLIIQNGTLDGMLDGDNFSQGIRIDGDKTTDHLSDMTLENITIQNCYSDSDGAGIYYASELKSEDEGEGEDEGDNHGFACFYFNGVKLSNNIAGGNGGGLYVNGDCKITFDNGNADNDCTEISSNKALNGGGIYVVDWAECDAEMDFLSSRIDFKNNQAKENGGAIYSNIHVHFSDDAYVDDDYWGGSGEDRSQTVNFGLNRAENGGAVYIVTEGEFSLYINEQSDSSASFTGKKAANGSGGAFFMEHETELTLVGSVLTLEDDGSATIEMTGNTATEHGGAIAIDKDDINGKDYDTEIDFEYLKISDNHAKENGGALYINIPDIDDEPFSCDPFYCECDSSCDCDYDLELQFDIENALITDNTAGNNGGGVYIWGPTITPEEADEREELEINLGIVFETVFLQRNGAENHGGGLYIEYPTYEESFDFSDFELAEDCPMLTNLNLSDNWAAKNGGGIWCSSELYLLTNHSCDEDCPADCDVSSSLATLIHHNTAENGGGIYNEGRLVIGDPVVTNNEATNDGGGIYSKSPIIIYGNPTVDEEGKYEYTSQFKNNIAGNNGAGIYSLCYLNLVNIRFELNDAENYGGGIYSSGFPVSDSDPGLRSLEFIGNEALDGAGLYCILDAPMPDPCAPCPGEDEPELDEPELDEDRDYDYTFKFLTFESNKAINRGGGIYFDITPELKVELVHGTFSGNKAQSGGGIYTTDLNPLYLPLCDCEADDTTFTGNKADTVHSPTDIEKAIHDTHIEIEKSFSVLVEGGLPSEFVYNNYDINCFQMYTVTVLSKNGKASANPTVAIAGQPVSLTAYADSGYKFNVWSSDNAVAFYDKNTDNTNFPMLAEDVTVTAAFTKTGGNGGGGTTKPTVKPEPEEMVGPTLDTENHFAYIFGYTDNTVKPENNITRAEVSAIFYRLLTDSSRDAYFKTTNNFADVATDRWYNTSVSTMANAKIVSGYEDGLFRGDNFITRAEFASIAARFDSNSYSGNDKFTDISGHWAANQINRAAQKGWISGYPDGTFKPDQYITRAEAVALVNRVLERNDVFEMLDGMITWKDNKPDAWYYVGMQEAGNGHDYVIESDGEVWTALRSK